MARRMNALLLTLVAVTAALPSNYDAQAVATSFTEESAGDLDTVIEEPNSKVPSTTQSKTVTPKEHDTPAEFKDDPLAHTVVNGRAEDFMNTFKTLDIPTEKIVAEDAATSGMVMPPVEKDEELVEKDDDGEDLSFKKPSEPISKGFEKLEESTESVVKKEAHLPAEGATQKEAEEAGEKAAAKAAPAPAPSPTSHKAAAAPKAATEPKKADHKLATQNKPSAVKVAATGKLSSAQPASKNSASRPAVTYLTLGLTAVTAIVVGAL